MVAQIKLKIYLDFFNETKDVSYNSVIIILHSVVLIYDIN